MKKYSQTLNIGIVLLLLSILFSGCNKKADELPDWQVDVSYVGEVYAGEPSNFVVKVSKKCDITLYVDGTQQQSVSSTKMNFDVSTLPVGLHNIKISINDGYGTYDKSYQCRIKEKPVVYQKPTITCHKVEQANYGESSVITASTKTDSEMTLYVDGAKQQSTNSKTLSFDVFTLPVGTHQIKIVAVNGDKKDEVSFNCEIVDNTPVLSCNTIERCNYGETAILTASTQIDSKITLYVDGAEMQSSASRELRYDVSELPVGIHQIKIVAVNGDKKDEVSFNCEIVDNTQKKLTFTIGDVSFDMIYVEEGSFQMGATPEQGNDVEEFEKPVHFVTLDSYYIGETEVTQALWEAVMGSNSNPSHFQNGSDYPVELVDWNDIVTNFLPQLNNITGKEFRLPTEAEWEYASRGGSKSRGFKYSGSERIDEVAWINSNSNSSTHPVKQKTANELGLYDMTGNVSEWCQDYLYEYTTSPSHNPSNPSGCSGCAIAIRGGSWSDGENNCRVSFRYGMPSGIRSYNFGFRLVLCSQ